MKVSVTCYAGYRGDETPRSLTIEDREIRVRSVKARWQSPDYRYFKVLGDDGNIYRLRFDGSCWELI
ncbi:MAG TPA: hypothetical protein VKN73_09465 [Desulfosalsimonadaceae bacterium]|nr:hypothetical protein [Desulfosalsimonadaceae bacterium]